ncbi:TetR/AcrR family transcriptional regulator [Nocardia huaxiensis]|uniref:TetR/AcrR family transcriptional regulator n=1 Tax=Nocardia huaxiensis TaxID=2755382 RepID=A0A7D6V849_9NOCA|nr:TetR/AcrR family transcriptional regulator [Nocardia huaxiensis]QLY29881.1 TetR/AcrR family transcriptional regulator [Nocardia huaxiensis]UFS96531.1 TetR/AcrR family transcriptional regulator [Nocardia huaxiensis]
MTAAPPPGPAARTSLDARTEVSAAPVGRTRGVAWPEVSAEPTVPSSRAAAVPPVRVVAPSGASTRADARRNRALVLAAAQRAFAEHGTGVSLAEIARRAGVGAGTVHRHFPTKTELVEAVVQQRLDRLTAIAVSHRDAADPGAAFFAFCTEVVASTPGNQALCDLIGNDGWPRELMREAGTRFHRALADLLDAAHRQRAVRPDLTLPDVLAIFTGCVAIQRLPGTTPGISRPAAMVLDAMRPASPRPVTKPETPTHSHNETRPRNETSATACPICASPVHPTGTGRPPRYCSPACRQKAHRQRHATPRPDSTRIPQQY